MVLSDLLTEDLVILDLTGSTRDEVMKELVDALDKTGALCNREEYMRSLYQREEESSTGIGLGIAIPHGKSAGVAEPRVAFGRKLEGIDWNSFDGEKAKLVFMIAVPEEQAGNEHLKILQSLSRKLIDDSFRAQLLNTNTKDEVMALINTM
jgi:fructose-specific phosphotransferase system IIA component